MMNILVVYAHPNPNSLSGAILEQVERGLKETGHTYTILDLYRENFNPNLVFDEKRQRRDLKNDFETAHYRELVLSADHLIFIHPIWWSGPPAILKGFFDRVLVSGFAYKYDGMLRVTGLLPNKSAWVFYTMDAPSWYTKYVRRDAEWVVMRDAVLKVCGIRKAKRFVFAGVRRSTESRREKWLDFVYEQVRHHLG